MIVSYCGDCGTYQYLPYNRLCRDCYIDSALDLVRAHGVLEGAAYDEIYEVFRDRDDLEVFRYDGVEIHEGNELVCRVELDTMETVVFGETFEETAEEVVRFTQLFKEARIRTVEDFEVSYVHGFDDFECDVVAILESSEEFDKESENEFCTSFKSGGFSARYDKTDLKSETVRYRANGEQQFRDGLERFLRLVEAE